MVLPAYCSFKGPGCSSLDGFFYEHGAFHVTEPIVNSTGGVPSLYLNPYRWSAIANVVFLEAPAGVGFSYADTPAGTVHNDTGTAADNYAAVAQFLKGFPELATNDLYIAGESYAGAYVPMLYVHPTPYHRAPCTAHRTPCTVHRAPHTADCALFLTPPQMPTLSMANRKGFIHHTPHPTPPP